MMQMRSSLMQNPKPVCADENKRTYVF